MSTSSLIILISILVVLLASGYRFDFQSRTLQGTGIISVSSTPDGGLVFINEVPKDATNTSILELKPGEYKLQIEKQGFSRWEKTIGVKQELVTKVNALLLPLFPSLKPLTYTGVDNPTISPDGSKIVYTVSQTGLAGLWLVTLDEQPFNINKQASIILSDTEALKYSQTSDITWSPDGSQLLLELPNQIFTYSLANNKTEVVIQKDDLLNDWAEQASLQLDEKLARLSTEVVATINSLENSSWSPDDELILYSKTNETSTNYYIYSIPGSTLNNQTVITPSMYKDLGSKPILSTPINPMSTIKWYADSRHLIIVTANDAGQTNIEIIEIDGENRNQVFSGDIKNMQVFSNPSGSKIIAVTKFNPKTEAYNLYSIDLR